MATETDVIHMCFCRIKFLFCSVLCVWVRAHACVRVRARVCVHTRKEVGLASFHTHLERHIESICVTVPNCIRKINMYNPVIVVAVVVAVIACGYNNIHIYVVA